MPSLPDKKINNRHDTTSMSHCTLIACLDLPANKRRLVGVQHRMKRLEALIHDLKAAHIPKLRAGE